MEEKLKHLEFIQNVVTRMANNSFLLKGWAITLVVAIIGLSKDDLNLYVLAGVIVVTMVFWLLDGYYLFQERLFRQRYDEVREKENSNINFSMELEGTPNSDVSWHDAIFSKTVALLYTGLIVAILFVGMILLCKDYLSYLINN